MYKEIEEELRKKQPLMLKDGHVCTPAMCLNDFRWPRGSTQDYLMFINILKSLEGCKINSVEWCNEKNPETNPDGTVGFFKVFAEPTA